MDVSEAEVDFMEDRMDASEAGVDFKEDRMDALEARADFADVGTDVLSTGCPSLPQGSLFNRALRACRRPAFPGGDASRGRLPGGSHQPETFGILCYHRVSPHFAGVAAQLVNVTPPQFEKQIRGLLARNFRPWSLRRRSRPPAARRAAPAEYIRGNLRRRIRMYLSPRLAFAQGTAGSGDGVRCHGLSRFERPLPL